MKLTYYIPLILIALITSTGLCSTKYSDIKKLEMEVGDYAQVLLFNKYGEVNVTGISGTKAYLKVTRTLEAKSKEALEKVKDEVYLDTMVLEDHLYYFIQNPYSILEIEEIGGIAHYNSRDSGKWRWSNNGERDVKYIFSFEVQMPMNIDFRVSTHKEDLRVNNMRGRLNASAHFGDIYLKGVKNLESVSGHHGKISVQFAANPSIDGKYRTHHGSIELEFPSTPSADVSMSSYHGKFFTDFDWKPIPFKTTKENNNRGTKYKIGSNTIVRMGNGRTKMSLKTHHGDMYIRKSS
ncbi:MAG: hypothetical protein V3V00_04005 [Saprospiraceae bacterium]